MPSERKHPSPATEQYVRGMELYRHGRFEEAAAELAGVQDRSDPMGRVARFHAGMAWRNLGVEALAQGRFDRAEKHFRAAIDAVGPQADLAGYLAAVYARTHRYERCAAQMKRAIDCGGDDAAARRRLAQAQWRTGRRPQAYMTLAEAVRRFGPQAHLHFQLGLFYAAQARYAEARDSMKRATDADCTNGRMHYYLALTAAAMGDAPAAVRSFQRAFALRPNDLMGAYQLALAARVAGRAGCRVVVRLPEPTAAPAPTGTRQLARYVAGEPDFVESFLALPASGIDSELFGLLAGVLEAALAEHPDYADRVSCRRSGTPAGPFRSTRITCRVWFSWPVWPNAPDRTPRPPHCWKRPSTAGPTGPTCTPMPPSCWAGAPRPPRPAGTWPGQGSSRRTARGRPKPPRRRPRSGGTQG